MEDPQRRLEQAYIDKYLRVHGHEPEAVRLLPPDRAKALLEAARCKNELKNTKADYHSTENQ
jgi:hypothetical protein